MGQQPLSAPGGVEKTGRACPRRRRYLKLCVAEFVRIRGCFGMASDHRNLRILANSATHRPNAQLQSRRSGLAPLELVIALPILLGVCALMIIFGTVATWRVRGEIVSRDAVWRARWPRTGERESPPANWPADARCATAGGPQIAALDHPDLDHAVARGPLPNGFRVLDTLDPLRGSQEGTASVVRRYPMLPRLGPYRSGDIEHPLLDLKRPCSEMGIPNEFRRSIRLYDLPSTDQSLPRAVASAGRSLFGMPNYSALYVLDRDGDIARFRGGCVDFHPWVRHPYPSGRLVVVERCQLDPEVVRTEEVERLVDTLDEQGRAQLHQISRLPRRLTNFFLSMYQSQVDSLKANIERWNNQVKHRDTRPETRRMLRARIAQAEAELARIEPFLAPLEAFQARLNEIEDGLRAQVEARIPQEGP